MKMTISIPEPLNSEIEDFLQANRISRDDFFLQAARFYLDKVSEQQITANLDQVYSKAETEDDVVFRRAALAHFRDLF
jgi:metal-responsive CopG/Arc/MetJ family transcriptional regulator